MFDKLSQSTLFGGTLPVSDTLAMQLDSHLSSEISKSDKVSFADETLLQDSSSKKMMLELIENKLKLEEIY